MNAPYAPPLSFEETIVAVAQAGISGRGHPQLRWAAASGANEGIPAEGGFAVSGDTSQELIEGIDEWSTLYKETDRQPITVGNLLKMPTFDERDRAKGSRFGGLQLYWPNEAGTVTASQPTYRSVNLYLNKLMGTTYATSELFEDVPALAAILRRAFTLEAGTMIDEAIIAGPGAGQMLGILNSTALITVEPESGQAQSTVRSENILKMWARMFAPGQRRAIWLYNSELAPQIFSLNSGSQNLVTFGDSGPLLMGRPLLAHESCKAPNTVGDILLVDPTQYVIGERPPEMAESLMLRFIQHEAAFRFSWRIAGSPGWSSALTPLNGTNTVSPFVTLAAR